VKPIDPQAAVEAIWKLAPKYAAAKGNVTYMEEYRKSLKAILMKASIAKTAVDREADAYADTTYIEHIKALGTAVEEAERLRWQLIASEAAIEIWRSQEASNRMTDKATR
jgi:hypothetical protein